MTSLSKFPEITYAECNDGYLWITYKGNTYASTEQFSNYGGTLMEFLEKNLISITEKNKYKSVLDMVITVYADTKQIISLTTTGEHAKWCYYKQVKDTEQKIRNSIKNTTLGTATLVYKNKIFATLIEVNADELKIDEYLNMSRAEKVVAQYNEMTLPKHKYKITFEENVVVVDGYRFIYAK